MIVHVWILFLLLLGKHAIIANVVDIGYSASRSRQCNYWIYSLVYHVTWEIFISTLLVVTIPVAGWQYFLIVEILLHVLCCLIERRAHYTHMLRTHVVCEITLMVLYAAMAALT